jgi:hypothetical protein
LLPSLFLTQQINQHNKQSFINYNNFSMIQKAHSLNKILFRFYKMKKIILYCFFFIVAFKTNAQTSYDVYTYTEPANFVKEANMAGIVTYSHQTDSTYCVIALYENTITKGSIQKDFDAAWKATTARLKLNTIAKKEPIKNADGWKMLTGYATITFEGLPSVLYLNTISGNGIAANVMYLTNSDSYSSVLEAFQSSLDVNKPIVKVNSKPSAIAKNTDANFGSGKMDGVWVAYFLSYVTKGMMFDQKIFLSNGKFLNDMPHGGLDNFAPDNLNPLYTYTLNGNNGKTIDAANKYPGTFTIKAPNKIELESHTYFKSANPNGKFITASYTSWSEENSPEFKAQPKGNRPVIHFNSNGKFEDEGIFKHLQYEDPTKKAGKGTYNIKNYSLYLTYDDGRPVQKFSIATFGEATQFEDAKIVMIGGGQLYKMKNK